MADSQPLLRDAENGLSDDPPGYTEADANKASAEAPSIGQDELPPPYSINSPSTLHTHVNCKVCQATINLEGRSHLYVVNCSSCNEATPIKNAPPGKKYIRCPCNCLLMCSVGAVRIACPRENCKRMIGLQPQVTRFTSQGAAPGSTVRVRCCHCQQTFVFPKRNIKHKLACCPHCAFSSAVGRDFINRKVLLFVLIGVFFLLLGVITTVVAVYTFDGVGVYVVWIGAYIVGALNILRALFFCRIRVSEVLEID